MEVLQIFLLFLIACFGSANWCYMGDSIMDRPIIISSLVGLVLGDFKAGLIIGGQLELAWIGIYAIGVSLPSDVVSGAIIGTYVAMTTGTSFEVAAAVGLPTGMLIAYVKTLIRSAMSPLVGLADKYAEKGEVDKLCRLHHIFGLTNAIPPAICSVLFIIAGSPFIERLVNAIPENIMTGLSVASNMLPARWLCYAPQRDVGQKVYSAVFHRFCRYVIFQPQYHRFDGDRSVPCSVQSVYDKRRRGQRRRYGGGN